MTPDSTALTLFLSLGGVTWFDALPSGPKRYEAVDMMTREVMRQIGSKDELAARKAVGRAISEARKVRTE